MVELPIPDTATQARVVACTRTFACMAYGPVLVTSWRSHFVLAEVEQSLVVGTEIHARYGAYASVSMVGTDVVFPTPEVRQAMRNAVRAASGRDLYNVLVLEGSGFWASAARAAMTSLTILAGTARRDTTCGSIDEMARLVADNVAGVDPAGLAAASRSLRASH